MSEHNVDVSLLFSLDACWPCTFIPFTSAFLPLFHPHSTWLSLLKLIFLFHNVQQTARPLHCQGGGQQPHTSREDRRPPRNRQKCEDWYAHHSFCLWRTALACNGSCRTYVHQLCVRICELPMTSSFPSCITPPGGGRLHREPCVAQIRRDSERLARECLILRLHHHQLGLVFGHRQDLPRQGDDRETLELRVRNP